MSRQVAVIGAGPHGLATTAYLRAAGADVITFGDPLAFWRDHMPEGMFLRSSLRATAIADPERRLSLDAWAKAEGRELRSPFPLPDFLDYALWYQRQVAPDVDRRQVQSVHPLPGGFRLTLDDGETLTAARVVVAAGIEPFPRVPSVFAPLVGRGVSHAVDHRDLGEFAGRRVAVVGAGQSALESVALLHERGADVELIGRARALTWLSGPPPPGAPPRSRLRSSPPTDVGGPVSGWLAASPDIFRLLPRRLQPGLAHRAIRPAGAHWLRDRCAPIRMTLDRTVTAAEADGAAHLTLSDGSRREVEHVLLATGYEVDVRRYAFLPRQLLDGVRLADGYPVLSRGLESTVPGLHFVGAPAAHSFGPIMRFVTGTWYDAPEVAAKITAAPRRRSPRWAF